MDFELLDRYLLDGTPEKRKVVDALLKSKPPSPQAAAFLEGMRMLGARTPDLSLVALRLVLAGKQASDDAVVALKRASDEARAGGAHREEAVTRYRDLVAP
ncbi:MAG TPA: hypothetical protein VFL13_08470 [Candidatus Baltobacteraceae bacterium]|nr:hypothetical protein [Candidatus Baltobacteraceae bacterium]